MKKSPSSDQFGIIAGRLIGPLLLLMIFLIVTESTPHRSLLLVMAHGGIALFIAFVCHEQRTGWKTAGMMGAFYGGLISLLVSVVLFILDINLLTFFRILSHPTIAAFTDGIATAFFYLLISSIPATRPLLTRMPEEDTPEAGI